MTEEGRADAGATAAAASTGRPAGGASRPPESAGAAPRFVGD